MRVSILGATRWRPKRITDQDVREWPRPTNESGNRIIRERNLEKSPQEESARRRSPHCNKEGRPHRSGRAKPDPGTRAHRWPSSTFFMPAQDRRSNCSPTARSRRQSWGNHSENPAPMLSARTAASTAPLSGSDSARGDRRREGSRSKLIATEFAKHHLRETHRSPKPIRLTNSFDHSLNSSRDGREILWLDQKRRHRIDEFAEGANPNPFLHESRLNNGHIDRLMELDDSDRT